MQSYAESLFRRQLPCVLLLSLWLCLPLPMWADEPYARNRTYDLQNSRIELKIEPESRSIQGSVTHTLTPLHGSISEVEFDSVGLTIAKATVNGKSATFETKDGKLRINLPSAARAGQILNVAIDYSGKPKRGMYFVLPEKNYPNRPAQVWTQGESEDTRYYIPIYDYPNDMATNEILLTVPDSWTAIANGRLLETKPAGAGKKTWHWKQSTPHSTYLIAIAAGEFAEVKETWRGIPVTYYAPKDRGHLLKGTYKNTRAMMDFFSEKFGVPYPWEKYAQATVDEFVADGMENVSLTINTTRDFMYPESAAEIRYESDWLVSHELAHQWFGDLVTNKDWANIWLNEAFASYGDTLWREHSLGKDDAAYYVWNEGRQWMQGQGQNFVTPVVTHDFTEFVTLSGNFYSKGDQIVHMLRGKLGDEKFFKAIAHYLKKHAHQNVVTDDLAKAIEESTGVNVDSFMQQWIYQAGAPRFKVSYVWDEANKQVKLKVEQTQKVEGYVHLFRLPIPIEIVTDGGSQRHTIRVSQASEEFSLPAASKPRNVVFDAGNTLLDATNFEKPASEWIHQLKSGATVPDRAEAARALRTFKDDKEVVSGLGAAAVGDSFWGVRVQAILSLGAIGGPQAKEQILAAMANSEPWVRSVAAQQLGVVGVGDEAIGQRLEAIYRDDKAFTVRSAALNSLGRVKTKNALDVLRGALAVESPEDILRSGALQGLSAMRSEAAVPLLLEWAAAGKPLNLRPTAVAGLGQVDKKNKQITNALVPFLKEPYFQLQFSTIAALGARGDADAISAMEELAGRDDLPFGFMEAFIKGQVQAIRAANRPAGAAPAQTTPSTALAPAATTPESAVSQQILQAIERLQREMVEITDRLKKLEGRLPEKKE